jgi:uncharacterized membrane protein
MGFLRRLLYFFGPPAVVYLAWWLVDRFAGPGIARECLVAAGLFLTFVGPTVILGPAVVGTSGFERLSTWSLVGLGAFMTVVTAFFWAYNLDLLERVPKFGPALKRSRARMGAWLARHPWVRRIAVVSTGFFVLMPFPGSGTFGGSVLGTVAGLSRWATFWAVSIGGVLVTLAYGWFGGEIQRLAERYQFGTAGKIAVALGFVIVLWLVGKLILRLGAERPEDREEPTP